MAKKEKNEKKQKKVKEAAPKEKVIIHKIKKTPFVGANKFVYYKDNKPHYVYSTSNLPLFPNVKPRWKNLLLLIPVLLVLTLLWMTAFVQPIKPILARDKNEIAIVDNIDFFTPTEEDRLRNSMILFTRATGITPKIVTTTSETWNLQYADINKFAQDEYKRQFTGEDCLLLIYSANNTTQGWEYDSHRGSNTTPILTKVLGTMETDIENRLHLSTPVVAFEETFNSATKQFANQETYLSLEKAILPLIASIVSIGFVFFMTFRGVNRGYSFKQLTLIESPGLVFSDALKPPVSEGAEETFKVLEKKPPAKRSGICPHCGRLYSNVSFDECPFCHKELPPVGQTQPQQSQEEQTLF